MTLRGVIWCAVSTKPQADEDEKDSLPQQEREGRTFCERENLEVVDVLVVPGHSRLLPLSLTRATAQRPAVPAASGRAARRHRSAYHRF